MNRLKIEGSEDTPAVLLDPGSNEFKLSGESRPENTAAFFAPVLTWMSEFETDLLRRRKEKTDISQIRFAFSFEYFNSTSAKYIMDILRKLQDLHKHKFDVVVEWHYVSYDEDMLEAGQEWAKLIHIPFEYISH